MDVITEPLFLPTPQVMEHPLPKPMSDAMCDTQTEAEAWATAWWGGYQTKVAAQAPDLYLAPHPLYALLNERDGKPAPVKLLRLSWLLRA